MGKPWRQDNGSQNSESRTTCQSQVNPTSLSARKFVLDAKPRKEPLAWRNACSKSLVPSKTFLLTSLLLLLAGRDGVCLVSLNSCLYSDGFCFQNGEDDSNHSFVRLRWHEAKSCCCVSYISFSLRCLSKFLVQPYGRHYAMEKWAQCAYRWLEGPCLAWGFTGIRHRSFKEIWRGKWLFLNSSNEINIVISGPDHLRGYGKVKSIT